MEKILLSDLNEAQRKAVTDTEGPSLVIAGAGSGKTRVLTYRIAYLLHKGVYGGSILALTFTNKAAKEMKERIYALVGENIARSLWMGTFHSIFARILRYEAEIMGYTKNYTIYDTIDTKSIIKAIIRELDLDEKVYKPTEIAAKISKAKNNLITPQAYAANLQLIERDTSTRKPRIVDIYKLYALRCRKADAMDFDDLLLNTNILFRDFPEILKKYQHLFKYILVDEYQDTNYSQYVIINKLGDNGKNICVVGDDAQSIYSFRGAKIENILNFKKDYPDYKLFKLEQNYRSTKNIVEAANSLIAKNTEQIHKKVWTDKETGEKITISKAMTDAEEGFIIANSIIDTKLNTQQDFQNFAILYRTNAQSRIFEETLRKKNIPYRVYGSLSFYQRKEIKDVLAYFRIVINHKDEESLKRIINYPARGIGKTTIEKIAGYANEKNNNLWDIIEDPEKHKLSFNKGTIKKLLAFSDLIKSFSNRLYHEDAYDLAKAIATETGVLQDLNYKEVPENIARYENVHELLNSIKEFSDSLQEDQLVTLDRFMENVALLTDADTEEDDNNKVTLMTIHSAKGLEFNYLYIAGVEEDLFPSRQSVSNLKELEEERRLFYVAITRAKKRAIVTYSQTRYKWGDLTHCRPSRFIQDINQKYLELPDNIFEENHVYKSQKNSMGTRRINSFYSASNVIPMAKARTLTPEKQEFTPDDPSKIQVGMQVEHNRFGMGKILHLDGTAPNVKATVFFKDYGQKQLLLKFAKLRVLNH